MKKEISTFVKAMLVFAFFLSSTSLLTAQTTPEFPYFEGFEDPALDATWIFANGSYVNEWYIGEAESAAGNRGLYVSGDGGATADYQNSALGVGVYKSFNLPAGNHYQISFDYKLGGEVDSNGDPLDSLLVFWVTDPDANVVATAGDIPTALNAFKRGIENNDALQGPNFWHNATIRVRGSDDVGRLVFYWINNSSNSNPPAACVDNIQIMKEGETACDRPSSLQVRQDGGVRLTWEGNSNTYLLRYKNEITNEWTDVTERIEGSPYTLRGLDKGIYTFWLRGVCGTDTTVWTVFSNYLLPVSVDNCLNFADLTSSALDPRYGVYGGSAIERRGLVDYGYASIKSRHTVHYRQDETDPRTEGKLRTVPPGEIASVRLGNWSSNSESESLTYTFTVDRDNPILLIKYAAVLEDGGHNGQDFSQPRFRLRLTDARDVPLDNSCLSVDYLAADLPGWNRTPGGLVVDGIERFPIVWKDWTTMGMNLSAHAGRTVKLYLETGDCSAPPGLGCFGYAYFALDCAPDKFQGLTCGAAAETIDEICAPPGFRYYWYKVVDPYTEISNARCFRPLPGDTATYKCRMNFIDLGREQCNFELTAALLPRYPKADASYNVCRREVQFFDESHVYTQNGIIDEECELYWDFGDSVSHERNPVYEFATPGTYEVKLYASINNGECIDVWSDSITVSNDTIKTELDVLICRGQRYTFGERELTVSGFYTDTLKTHYGCDSISLLNLTVHEPYQYDTICEGIYHFEGQELTLATGLHELKYQNVVSVYGCDSILFLYIAAEIMPQQEMQTCGDAAQVMFNLIGGDAQSVRIEFDERALTERFENATEQINNKSFKMTLPESVRPGVYNTKFIFTSSHCGESEMDFSFTVSYPSGIISQRWNDVLYVLNSENNGGYQFTAYQWYKNDEKIDGAIGSYLYVEEGLDTEAEYKIELKRLDDAAVLFTCPMIPQLIKREDVTLTLVTNLSRESGIVELTSTQKGKALMYDISGILMKEQDVSEGQNQLKVPDKAGYYVLRVELDSEVKTYQIHVVK